MHRLGKIVVPALALLTCACSSGSSSKAAAGTPTSGGAAGSGTAGAATSGVGATSAAGAAAATSGSAAGATSAAAAAAGSQAGASGAAAKDPCALITAADAAPVVGAKVAPTETQFNGVSLSCTYSNGSIDLTVTSRLISRAGFEASIKTRTAEVAPLPGVCQDAYASGSVVLAWKNGTEVDSRLFGSTGDPVAAGKTLVAAACARL